MIESENPAYDKLYLADVMEVHRYLFTLMEKNPEYDTFSMIDSYMQHSPIRAKMDQANWSALNKSGKQLYNDIPLEYCKKKTDNEGYDDILLGWMADMYVLLQWKYNLPSSYIDEKIPAQAMAHAYNPLHETSYKNAVEKLQNKYLK